MAKQASVWSILHSHTKEKKEKKKKNEIFVEWNFWHSNWVKLKDKTNDIRPS